MLTAREIVRKQYPEAVSNLRIIRYGKINSNVAYEITQNNGPYLDGSKYNIIFAEYNPENERTYPIRELNLYDEELKDIEEHIKILKQY